MYLCFKTSILFELTLQLSYIHMYQLNSPIIFHDILIGATDYTGLRTPILHQQLFWVLMQQLFITVAYYIGDSENIEKMQHELCILFLDREHSEIRGLRTIQKRVPFSDKYYKQVHLLHQQVIIFL